MRTVPRCAVAEVCALSQRPSTPRQLAARDRKLLVKDMGERRDDPWRAVAPLGADLAVAVCVESRPREWWPVREPILLDGKALERLRDGGDIAERKHTPCEPVRETEIARPLPVQLLRPQALCVTSAVQPLDARRHVKPEFVTRENRAGTAPHQFATFVSLVRRDELRQPPEISLRRCEPL